MQVNELPVKSITNKLKELRNRFYDLGDDTGVLLCENLADDLGVDIQTAPQGEKK